MLRAKKKFFVVYWMPTREEVPLLCPEGYQDNEAMNEKNEHIWLLIFLKFHNVIESVKILTTECMHRNQKEGAHNALPFMFSTSVVKIKQFVIHF